MSTGRYPMLLGGWTISTAHLFATVGHPIAALHAIVGIDLSRLAQFTVNGVVVGSILALAAVGLTLVYGILRIANFAHGDLLTLGTYLSLYFLALITLRATLTWAFATAFLLLLSIGLDRAYRRRSRASPALSNAETGAVAYGAAALVVLGAGVALPWSLAAAHAALVVAGVAAVPLLVRYVRTPSTRRDTGRFYAGAGTAVLALAAAHLVVPLQVGPGGWSFGGELAFGVAVFAAGCFAALPTPGRDPWAVSSLAAAGLLAMFLFADPILLSVALALGGVAIFAVVLERFVWKRARRQGAGLLTLIIISIGIMLALRNSIVILWGTRQRAFPDTLRRGESILGTEIVITPHQGLAVAVALLVILLLHLFLRHAKVGKAMRALADDMELARISGIQVDRVVVYVWMISGALTALAGILYGMVRPFDPNLGWYQLLPIFAAVILGGIGSPYGALLGGFTIGIAMETSPFFGVPTDYKLAVGFGILILVMIFRPRGILGVQSFR